MKHVKAWWNINAIPFGIDEVQKQKIINAILKAEGPLFYSEPSFCKDKTEQKITDLFKDTPLSAAERNKRLLEYCLYELQTLTGPKTFYFSVKKLEEVLGYCTAKHWWELLNQLEFDGQIKKIKNGELKSRRASEFIYIDHPCWGENKESKEKHDKLMKSATHKKRVLNYIKKHKGNMGLITEASHQHFSRG